MSQRYLRQDVASQELHSSQSSTSSDSNIFGIDEEKPIEAEAENGVPVTSDPSKDLAAADEELRQIPTSKSCATDTSHIDLAFEVDFYEDDASNPRNWSLLKRGFTLFTVSYTTLTVVTYSSAYTAGIPGMMESFGLSENTVFVLGITTYLFGLGVGSIVLAPLSEMYGRRPIYIVAIALFAMLIIPCALAPNLSAVLITRFFGAVAGSAAISNSPGTVNDIVPEEFRALAFSIWSIGPLNGPVFGPLVGGFVYQYMGWRWINWVVMIAAGVAFFMILTVPETYAPTLLRQRAMALRNETGDQRWWSRYDDKKEFWPLLKMNLSRPFIMAITEPICIFWNIYIAVVYAILYLCFVAYPIVFTEERGWKPAFIGLAYLGIGAGCFTVIVTEPFIRRMINSHKPDPTTGRIPPESMMSVICIASLCVPAGELIFAWTCTKNVHWIFPILAGIPFGAGNTGIFIYASNYLVHSYGIYAASALAGNSVARSLVGGTLPLAGPKLYASLGPNWAGTLLGLLELALVPIPFLFYRYGGKIREKSNLITKMQEDKEKQERKVHRAKQQRDRMNEESEKNGPNSDKHNEFIEV